MADIKKETEEALKKSVTDLQEQLRVFRFEGAGSRLRNVRAGRNLRHDIARTKTELRARELEAAKVKKVAPKQKIASKPAKK